MHGQRPTRLAACLRRNCSTELSPTKIDRYVEMLCVAAASAEVGAHSSAKNASIKVASQDLLKLARLADHVQAHIYEMHANAREAFDDEVKTDEGGRGHHRHNLSAAACLLLPPGGSLLNSHDLLFLTLLLDWHASLARRAVWMLPAYPTDQKNRSEAERVTEVAARIFRDLTRKSPTRITQPLTGRSDSGFATFLQEIFDQMGIQAVASYEIRKIRSRPGRSRGRPRTKNARNQRESRRKRH